MNRSEMKEITVNGEVYCLKHDVEEVLKENEINKPGIKLVAHEMMMDNVNVFGIGMIELVGEWHSVRLQYDYLKRIMDMLKILKTDKVDVVWAKNMPCGIGRLSEKGADNKFSGFILAPIVETD